MKTIRYILPVLALLASACIKDQNSPDIPTISVDEATLTRVSMQVNCTFGKNTDMNTVGVEVSESPFESGSAFNTYIPQEIGNGNFSLYINGLKPSGTYYLRAYVSDGSSKLYSKALTQVLPKTSVATLSNVTVTDGLLTATIEDTGGDQLMDFGFVWASTNDRNAILQEKRYGTTLSPTDGKTLTLPTNTMGKGTFYVLAYAENLQGTGFSRIPTEVEGTDDTPPVVVPTKYKYLTFTSEGRTTLSLNNQTEYKPVLYYSTNANDWKEWDFSELVFTKESPLYLCGYNPEQFNPAETDPYDGPKHSNVFNTTGDNFSIAGDIMSLVNADSDITVIPSDGYFAFLFYHCSNLTVAPSLSATTLSKYCYFGLFRECTSLIAAPELPAIELADYCYAWMFDGCTEIESAPVLPAPSLVQYCYRAMFNDCKKLNYVKCLATDIKADSCTSGWLIGVSSTGTFVKASTLSWPFGINGVPAGWTVKDDEEKPITVSKYLKFSSKGTTQISLKREGSPYDDHDYYIPVLYYSYDTVNWAQWDFSSLSFSDDSPLFLCGNNPSGFSVAADHYSFVSQGADFAVSGDIMSLVSYEHDVLVIPSDYFFTGLFRGCSNLTSAPSLPATTLTNNCYSYMFYECTGLKTAPELPATALAPECYVYMFYRCSALSSAPALPATTLARSCYSWMFGGCTSLKSAPALPATTLADNCYGCMFDGCTSLTATPALPATSLAPWCYSGMFSSCSGLTSISEIAATSLAEYCCHSMFAYCTNLTSAVVPPATALAESCYMSMFEGCTGLSSVPKLPATTLAHLCYSVMFGRCTGLTSAPELPATKMDTYCYQAMFYECTGLTSTPKLPATTLAEGSYYGMFDGCTGLISTSEISANSLARYSCYRMFNKCTNLKSVQMSVTSVASNCCYEMFRDCSNLVVAPELAATEMAEKCYGWMFYGCSRLQSAPELPATALAEHCYASMFELCSSLTSVPKLPATQMEPYCYFHMFHGCSSLTVAPALPATTMAEGCYAYMFCETRSLSAAPALPAMDLAPTCYRGMFDRCIKLSAAPELPATTLADYSYTEMFQECSNLSYIKCKAIDISAYNCLKDWTQGVSPTGTFVKAPNVTWPTGESGIPEGWTVVEN